MPTLSRTAALGLALLAFASSAWADASPRTHIDPIARAIEDHYFDAARAHQIAADLRAAAARGDFDRYTDNRDLATALTDRLKPLDRHFSVSWSPADQKAPPMRGPADDGGRRSNYGIRRVERLSGNVGYIDLRSFADFEFGKPNEPARRAIESAVQLVSSSDAIIIDLRGNGGGSPAMVGYLVSAFTAKGANIYNTFHYRDGNKQRADSEAPHDWYPKPLLKTPLYVLVGARTGSAAEAFAYTVKNAKRATIVGEPSAGAANPGGEVDAGDGFRIFVSDGAPISPITRTNWEGTGVIPDVAAEPAKTLDVALTQALQSVLAQSDRPEADKVDTRWALEALQAEQAPPKNVAFDDYAGDYGALRVGRDGDHLFVRRERRPPLALRALGDDVFAVANESSQRVVFERDGAGKVVAFEMRESSGSSRRFRRGE